MLSLSSAAQPLATAKPCAAVARGVASVLGGARIFTAAVLGERRRRRRCVELGAPGKQSEASCLASAPKAVCAEIDFFCILTADLLEDINMLHVSTASAEALAGVANVREASANRGWQAPVAVVSVEHYPGFYKSDSDRSERVSSRSNAGSVYLRWRPRRHGWPCATGRPGLQVSAAGTSKTSSSSRRPALIAGSHFSAGGQSFQEGRRARF